jgi:hypothetical protein
MVTSLRRGAPLAGLAAVLVLASVTLLAAPSRADDVEPAPAPAPRSPEPRVHHAPIASAHAHEEIRVEVDLERPELVGRMDLVYRTAAGELLATPFLRSDGALGSHVAVVPADAVLAPGVAYAIEIQRVDGVRLAAFASRADMQPVLVIDDHMDMIERAARKRLEGRRSVVSASADYASFGSGCAQPPCTTQNTVSDEYWRVEAGYTYRPLRTVAEFGIRLGVVRGSSPSAASASDPSKSSVGLNYAEPWLRFRMADDWHLDLSALGSVTEVGFSLGGGAALLIGDPYGTRLTLGGQFIGFGSTYFGSRIYTRLDILVKEGITVGPLIEATDMPHADTFGVRLLGDASFALPRGFMIGARAGYQARRSSSGGVSLGTTVGYAF